MPGVLVGHCTVSWGGPGLPRGSGPARTGVTAILPHRDDIWHERVVAGAFAANGVGEIVGISAVREWGLLETPIMLTNSQSVGAVYDATVRWMMDRDPRVGVEDACMPVVGECDDSFLNDMRGMHVHAGARAGRAGRRCSRPRGRRLRRGRHGHDLLRLQRRYRHVIAARQGPRAAVRARRPDPPNFGIRRRLMVDGVPVGREITDLMPAENTEGSCIVVLATDAPLTARQCERLAKRCALGLAAVGSYASDGSGEIMLAFSTALRLPRSNQDLLTIATVANDQLAELFEAAVDATAEAVVNSICMAQTTVGRDGQVAHAVPLDRLVAAMVKYGRAAHPPAGGVIPRRHLGSTPTSASASVNPLGF